MSPWGGDLDLISGLVGLGVCFLERLPSPLARRGLEQVVARLAELADRDEHGLSWFTPPHRVPESQRRQYPDGYVDFGLAHGFAGIVALLVSAHAAGIEPARTRALLEDALAWLEAHALGPRDDDGFPWGHVAGVEPGPARSAWCYGDPGIATALARAGRWLDRPAWTRRAWALMRRAGARPRGIVDPCVCHGSAGLLLMLQRARHRAPPDAARSGSVACDPELEHAMRRWLSWTLDARTPAEGIAGFRTAIYEDGERRWIAQPGVLEGAAGVALTLLAVLTDVAPAWDRIVLLSGVEDS